MDYVLFQNDGAICWKSFKKHIVIDLVCEAEYIAASNTAKKVVWLNKFIIKLRVASSLNGLVLLYYDNIGAIAQTKKLKVHQQTKHILYYYYLV